MISKNILPRTGLADFRRALDAYSVRQRVIAENIANVQTPGFRAKKVLFEENLNSAVSRRLKMTPVREPEGSIPIPVAGRSQVEVRNTDSGYFNGTNDVNMENEMTEIAKNTLAYKMVAKMTKSTIDMLRSAIAGKTR
ncbi:MAG: flagellar basal body rod protein FlgB [Candidatus Krumholzibacteriota bacterium]|nr:flagellar basal body rod protein FlgB [Candidatus Krumholzibacteriota bacterium]